MLLVRGMDDVDSHSSVGSNGGSALEVNDCKLPSARHWKSSDRSQRMVRRRRRKMSRKEKMRSRYELKNWRKLGRWLRRKRRDQEMRPRTIK